MISSLRVYTDVEEELAFRQAHEIVRRLFPPKEIDDVLRHYSAAEDDEQPIVRFLTRHPVIIHALLEAYPLIRSVFGRVDASLEIETDPEGDFEELFCVINIDAEPEQALALLWRFDQLWYGKAPPEARSVLNFTVDTANHEDV